MELSSVTKGRTITENERKLLLQILVYYAFGAVYSINGSKDEYVIFVSPDHDSHNTIWGICEYQKVLSDNFNPETDIVKVNHFPTSKITS